MILRPYQQSAIDAAYSHLERHEDDNPVIVIPTGGGKTPVIAKICADVVAWGGRVAILAHVKELLQQAADKLKRVGIDAGVYSSGLGERETRKQVTVAGIQSIYNKACDLGAVNLILIDECHLIPMDGDGMYRRFLSDMQKINPSVKLVGLTATPFRLGVGPICCDSHFLNSICYEVSVKQLIGDGFLSPIKAVAGQGGKVDWNSIQRRGGEFNEASSQQAMDKEELTSEACSEIVGLAKDRKSILIFTTGVNHANHVKEQIEKLTGEEVGAVYGDTPSAERAELLARFKGEKLGMLPRPPLRWLVNVNVLTTGFDAPNVDCVVLLRPTLSPGLFYQMVGRGFRLHPGKADCLVLDYGGNALRHGPVDKLKIKTAGSRDGGGDAPAKECPTCHAVICTVYSTCPECGHEFPPAPSKITPNSAGTPVLSGVITDEVIPVVGVSYSIHNKKGGTENDPRTMRVAYKVSLYESFSEWICLEHSGWAGSRARAWWNARTDHPAPSTVEFAVDLANAGVLAMPEEITLRHISGQKWPSVHAVKFGPKPELGPHLQPIEEDEVPF